MTREIGCIPTVWLQANDGLDGSWRGIAHEIEGFHGFFEPELIGNDRLDIDSATLKQRDRLGIDIRIAEDGLRGGFLHLHLCHVQCAWVGRTTHKNDGTAW